MSFVPLLWTTITFLFFIVSPVASAASSSLDGKNGSVTHRRERIIAHNGAVATDDGRCSKIGRDVLRIGGHAVDAAVAASLCLGVVSAASSGIGGGDFMLVREANGKTQAFDMRETAPMKASENMYNGNANLKANGVLSVAVPGELAGLHKAWKEHGKLPWKRLVKPAENLARNGFKISPYLRMQMESTKSAILADKGLSDVYTSNGELLKVGDICYNKKLAETLRTISIHGVEAFYNGSVGLNLVKDIQKAGGIITMDDLRNYKAKVRKPISENFLGLKILSMPPPSSGGVSMILMLNILAQYGFPSGISGSLGVHRLIESLKHAFAVRMNLGDPEFVEISKVVSDMLSPKLAKELKKTIYDNMTFGPDHYGGKWNPLNDHGTSHVSIVDKERNAVSMTNTVNAYFGAKILSPSTGIVLNNEMDDFSMPTNQSSANTRPPAPANFIRPGKRPLSSMTPTIVLKNEKLRGVVGASGGANIIAATTQVFLNHFARGMDPLSSVMAPRVYHQLIPNVVVYENWTTVTGDHFEVPADIRTDLAKKGHVLRGLAGGTISQLIVNKLGGLKGKGVLVAVSDPRKGGFPAGF
ncbi:Gamma-glutamyltranspeptidase [Corchorus olitorius]|uniref:Glutathione hydrolase n=1 Tax=Corchorus olitorius TaxID=93759 RepID=A0A1R3K607_9ROSI|nr:Gamma-glutamyltranspeptidase [Corchorus olitorius]